MKTSILALTASLFGLAAMAISQDQKAPAPGQHPISASDIAATQAYWTTDRMANAKPMPMPTVDPATVAAITGPLVPPGPARFGQGGLPTIAVSTGNLPSQTFQMLDHGEPATVPATNPFRDRKSTRLNSSHLGISYAVFCLK